MKFIKSKEFGRIRNFDFILVSFPTKHNLTNLLLATVIDEIKPKLIGRMLFKDLPITIIANKEFLAPSIDLYYKKIKNKKYLFVIGNYKPKNIEFYKKMYGVLKKGKEIIFLNEFTRKKGDLFYLRKEHRKSKFDLESIKRKFKEINNAVIRGVPSFIFEKAKKDKLNITLLFFNTNSEYLDDGFDAIDDLLGNSNINFEKIEELIKIKEEEKKINKVNYIG